MPDPQDPDLPLQVIDRTSDDVSQRSRKIRFRRRYLLILLVPLLMFTGAVIGMYFQPPGLKAFYSATGLQPGAGSASPIALPPEIVLPQEMVETMQQTDVVGLARLIPKGDISIVAPPYGAGDARIAEILVAIGDHVKKGTVVARLDNEAQLQSALALAEANLAVRQATYTQTQIAVQNSQDEARALLEQAQSAADEAETELTRTTALFKRGVATQATLDTATAAKRQADLAVQKAAATLARYTAAEVDMQPDVIVASRNVTAAEADLAAPEAIWPAPRFWPLSPA